MANVARGDVYFPERYAQQRDYSGLRFGNITPTDIDGLIEYKNRAYVIVELKMAGSDVPPGQLLALERLHDDLMCNGKKVLCIIAHHQTPLREKIDVCQALVTQYRFAHRWQKVAGDITTGALIERFLNYVDER